MKKKTSTFAAVALAATTALLAQPLAAQITFTDDFNRAEIGGDWTVHQGNWSIMDNQLTSGNTNTANVISFNGFDLADTPSFTFEADVAIPRATGWAGIAFHVQDASNYYMMRVRPDQNKVQFIAVVDGGNADVMLNSDAVISPAVQAGETYLFGVESPSAGEFNLYIRDLQGASMMTSSHSNTMLSGGEAGFYSGSTGGNDVLGLVADNSSLEVIPEPATAGMAVGALALGAAFWWRRRRA